MPVTGRYIARRIRRGVATYMATYVMTVQNEVLPAFAELNTRSDQIAKTEYDRLSSQPAPIDFDGDLSSFAEAATEKGQIYYNTMSALRRTSLTLYSVGLFHLLEQQLADLCRDGSFGLEPPKESTLETVVTWYKKNFRVDLRTLATWKKIDELRLVANTAKHGHGASSRQLRKLRPDLFQDPELRELLPDFPEMWSAAHVRLPLAGQDFFVSDEAFAEYGAAAFELVNELSQHFEARADEHFFTDA